MKLTRTRHAVLFAAALLTWPALAPAQSAGSAFTYHDWNNGHLKVKPHCVYKGAMSDAEIERCTGHPVHYEYDIGRAARASSPAARRP